MFSHTPAADPQAEVCSMHAFTGIRQVDKPEKTVNWDLYIDGDLGLSAQTSLIHFPVTLKIFQLLSNLERNI